MFSLLRNCQTISHSSCTILNSHHQHMWVPISPHPHQYLLLFPFDYSHPNGCEVVSHCGLDLHFPDGKWHWASFDVLVGHLYIFSGTMYVFFYLSIFKAEYLSFYYGVSYIFFTLDIYIRYTICKYFLPVCELSFHFLMVSTEAQMFLRAGFFFLSLFLLLTNPIYWWFYTRFLIKTEPRT